MGGARSNGIHCPHAQGQPSRVQGMALQCAQEGAATWPASSAVVKLAYKVLQSWYPPGRKACPLRTLHPQEHATQTELSREHPGLSLQDVPELLSLSDSNNVHTCGNWDQEAELLSLWTEIWEDVDRLSSTRCWKLTGGIILGYSCNRCVNHHSTRNEGSSAFSSSDRTPSDRRW